jgi:membrane protein YdbS with pleckstrin-like domain
MQAIGRAAAELLGLLVASVVSFFVMVGYAVGILFVWACGMVSVLFLIAALFSGTMWLSTHSHHAFQTMLGFFADAAVPFATIVLVSYYYGKLTDKLERRQRRQAWDRSGGSIAPEFTAVR